MELIKHDIGKTNATHTHVCAYTIHDSEREKKETDEYLSWSTFSCIDTQTIV